MKILLLVACSRSGADFFQSLLDGHSQILQFPGKLLTDNNFNEMLNLKDLNKIPEKFINLYPYFFNSKLNKIENHHRLGKKRNNFFKVNKEKFIKNFIKLSNNKRNLTKLNILKNLHIAYDLTKDKKKQKAKIILIHTHLISYTKNFIKFMSIKNISIIHTMRNPLSAINSPVKNWLNYQNGKHFFPINLDFHLDQTFNGIIKLVRLREKIFIVQLEKLHREHKKVMLDFCRIFKIKYEKCLKKSTFINLQWWGDAISGRRVSGINKNFNVNIDQKLFFLRDIKFFECLAEDIIKFYKYNFITENKKKTYFNFLPMKCEFLIWKNTFKQKRIKHIFSIPFFYVKRIFLFNKFSIKNKYFPYSIGSK